MLAVRFRQGAIVGGASGAAAGLVYGALTIGPSIGASAVLGADAGRCAGGVWRVTSRPHFAAVID